MSSVSSNKARNVVIVDGVRYSLIDSFIVGAVCFYTGRIETVGGLIDCHNIIIIEDYGALTYFTVPELIEGHL